MKLFHFHHSTNLTFFKQINENSINVVSARGGHCVCRPRASKTWLRHWINTKCPCRLPVLLTALAKPFTKYHFLQCEPIVIHKPLGKIVQYQSRWICWKIFAYCYSAVNSTCIAIVISVSCKNSCLKHALCLCHHDRLQSSTVSSKENVLITLPQSSSESKSLSQNPNFACSEGNRHVNQWSDKHP